MEALRDDDPARISGYDLLGRLGEGGMGRVYLGRAGDGREVAVKVIRREFAADPEFRTRFRRETAAMMSVSGPRTVPVVGADPDGDPAWVASAYVPARSLGDAVGADGPMAFAKVLELAAGLAEALAAIHAAGLTHRDLKPGNVLLADDGPRVIDFGLAVSAQNSALTRTGFVVGTPSFMSPEQLKGEPVGPASDIYSLGAVLAFAATGRTPHGDGSIHELVFRIVYQEPDLIGLDGPVHKLIKACLTKDPKGRPTPAAIIKALASMAKTTVVPAGAAGTAGTAGTPGRPVGPRAAGPTAKTQALRPAGPVRQADARKVDAQRAAAQRAAQVTMPAAMARPVGRPARNRTPMVVGVGVALLAAVAVAVVLLLPSSRSATTSPSPVRADALFTEADAAKLLNVDTQKLDVGALSTSATFFSRDYSVAIGRATTSVYYTFTIESSTAQAKNLISANYPSGDVRQLANGSAAVVDGCTLKLQNGPDYIEVEMIDGTPTPLDCATNLANAATTIDGRY